MTHPREWTWTCSICRAHGIAATRAKAGDQLTEHHETTHPQQLRGTA